MLGQTRWLMYAQSATEVPKPLVTVLIFWLTVIFISWGIYAPRNGTVAATSFVTAVSVSSAIFLILEMYTPTAGSCWYRAAAAVGAGAFRAVGFITQEGEKLGDCVARTKMKMENGELTLLGCVAVEGAAQNFNGMLNNSTPGIR